MKTLTCIIVMAASMAAQDPAKTPVKTPAKTAAKPAVKAAPATLTIPKDAVETSTGFYKWTDKDGKAWTYRRTPFGVSRWPADPAEGNQKTDSASGAAAETRLNAVDDQTTAKEVGDSIRFERNSPFGKRSWLRKKTELNDSEQAIW